MRSDRSTPELASKGLLSRRNRLWANHCGEQSLELELGLGQLGFGVGVGDHADAGDQPGAVAVEGGGADADGPFAVAVGVDPADRAGVAAAVEALDGDDPLERRFPWC